MVYLPTIPAANDRPAQSQAQIQENFTQLNTQFGAEHVAFDAAANNGQHRYITLQRMAVAAPTGTNVRISQDTTVVGNPFIKVGFAADYYSIPLMSSVSAPIPGGSHTTTIVDFGAAGLNLVPQTGNIFVYDDNSRTRTIFTPFVYIGGVLTIPSGAGINGQLRSGGTFVQLIGNGSLLRLETNGLGGATVAVAKITGNAI